MNNTLNSSFDDREWSKLRTRGATAENWCKRIFTGDANKFKKSLRVEFMNDFEKSVEEETKACNSLMVAFGKSFGSLKNSVEEQKVFIKKQTGEIKNCAEVLQQALDKFNRSVNDEKLSKITGNITTITDCIERLSKLENTGMLSKMLEILNK